MNKRKLVLMVDDDPDFLEATKAVIEGSGYKVITANSPTECFACLEKQKPNLIILDVMMVRDSSGFDVSRELKRNPATKDIPILMLSAVDQKYPEFNFPSAAGDQSWLPVETFLDKPVEAGVLIQHVRKLLKELP